VCTKSRFWKAVIPSAVFRVLSGRDALTQYRFGREQITHYFCRHCGVKAFGTGEHPALGGPFHAVNVACLDDLDPEELASLPIAYEDGRHDRWGVAPAVSRYL
jgi:hypothetical protein